MGRPMAIAKASILPAPFLSPWSSRGSRSGYNPGTHFVILPPSIAGGFGLSVGMSVDRHDTYYAGSVASTGPYSVPLELAGRRKWFVHEGDGFDVPGWYGIE